MLQETKRSEFIATFGHSVTYKKKLLLRRVSAITNRTSCTHSLHDSRQLEWVRTNDAPLFWNTTYTTRIVPSHSIALNSDPIYM